MAIDLHIEIRKYGRITDPLMNLGLPADALGFPPGSVSEREARFREERFQQVMDDYVNRLRRGL